MCKTCRNVGWINKLNNQMEYVVKCPDCLNTYLKQIVNIVPKRYNLSTFENYDVDFSGESLSLAYVKTQIQLYIEHIEKQLQGFLLCGQTGVGKTHLCAAFSKELEKLNIPIVMIDFQELIGYFLVKSTSELSRYDDILHMYFGKYRYVCITHIGSYIRKWDIPIFKAIIDTIYNMDKWIIIGTTYYFDNSQPSLEQQLGDSSIYSKLKELCPQQFLLEGIDYREYKRVILGE